jgi:uncharacterized protein YdaU (DUF1376 family)
MEGRQESVEPLPYYKWLWRDWRANRRVQRMSWQARGLYRELLDEFWAEGSIPDDNHSLADICGCTADEMMMYWPEVEPCWERVEGGLRNAKMDQQRTQKDSERAAKARAGRTGGLVSNSRTRAEEKEASAEQLQASAEDLSAQPDIAEQSRALAEHEQSKAKISSLSATQTDSFRNAWNTNCGTLPHLVKLSQARTKKLSVRIKDGLTLEQFTQAVQIAARTPFLRGETERGWKCNFDFLVAKEENLLKVLEGAYGAPESPKRVYRDVTDSPDAGHWLSGGAASA